MPADAWGVPGVELDEYLGAQIDERLRRQPFILRILAGRIDDGAIDVDEGREGEFWDLGGTRTLREVQGRTWAEMDPEEQRVLGIALVDHLSIELEGATIEAQVTVHWRL